MKLFWTVVVNLGSKTHFRYIFFIISIYFGPPKCWAIRFSARAVENLVWAVENYVWTLLPAGSKVFDRFVSLLSALISGKWFYGVLCSIAYMKL